MVEQGKPHPEIFLRAGKEALGEATFNPESCLVFEDAPLGIEAANRAGMQSVLVPDPNLSLEVW